VLCKPGEGLIRASAGRVPGTDRQWPEIGGSRERPGEESEINPDTTCCIFKNLAKSDRL